MIKKLFKSIKKHGFILIIKIIVLKMTHLIFYFIRKSIRQLLNSKYNIIILFENYFGYNKILFQRPQHMAINLSSDDILFLYSSNYPKDYNKNKIYNKIKDNLFIINLNLYRNYILKLLKEKNIIKYLMVYSTDNINKNTLIKYKEHNFKIIYEYVDDVNEELIDKEIINSIKDKHKYMLNNADVIVCTAKKLYDNAKAINKNSVVLINNGVDYNHFANPKNCEISTDFQKVIEQNKPIIGYYGALASWFDYDMIKSLAQQRPEYNIVFFGIKYDNSYDNNNLDSFSNIYYLDKISYNELPFYASYFDVCTIPFLINEITEATSPVKLFEYMAMGKPIVTSDMNECRNYQSVMIAKDSNQFIELVDYAVKLNPRENKDYFDTLKKEAWENTWESKAEELTTVLQQVEKL